MTDELTELRGEQTTKPGERQVVVFALGNESFGVDIDSVREIIRWQPVTHVPETPESVLGVLNLRGRIIPVVDLRNRLGMTSTEATNATRILVVDIGTDVGALVDSVTEVMRLSSDAIGELSPVVANANSEYIDGIAQTEDRLLILLSMERALAEPSTGVGEAGAGAEAAEAADSVERRSA